LEPPVPISLYVTVVRLVLAAIASQYLVPAVICAPALSGRLTHPRAFDVTLA
jgi:hypothetical protein